MLHHTLVDINKALSDGCGGVRLSALLRRAIPFFVFVLLGALIIVGNFPAALNVVLLVCLLFVAFAAVRAWVPRD